MKISSCTRPKKVFLGFSCFLYLMSSFSAHSAQTDSPQNKYVGVEACVECHEEIVRIYRTTSEKAVSDKAILKMRKKLTAEEFRGCLSCHTTGYGEPSGFVSFEQTPHLAVVGCESCHGMGYLHTIEQSVESIAQKPTLEVCLKCHDDSKVTRIFFDGRVHAGGH